jgi:hypothetical protein
VCASRLLHHGHLAPALRSTPPPPAPRRAHALAPPGRRGPAARHRGGAVQGGGRGGKRGARVLWTGPPSACRPNHSRAPHLRPASVPPHLWALAPTLPPQLERAQAELASLRSDAGAARAAAAAAQAEVSQIKASTIVSRPQCRAPSCRPATPSLAPLLPAGLTLCCLPPLPAPPSQSEMAQLSRQMGGPVGGKAVAAGVLAEQPAG